jgi:hypothetical protein
MNDAIRSRKEEQGIMSPARPAESEQKKNRELDLARRYGRIGISALAAALRYQGQARKPAASCADRDTDGRLARASA